LLLLFNCRPENPLKKTFLDELVDQAVIHGLAEIEIFQVGLLPVVSQ
jgi:hypothetical protein